MTATNWVHDIATERAYDIGKVLFTIQHDPAEEKRFFSDPSTYLQSTPLDAEASRAVVECDIAALYCLGVNPYLLRAYCLQLRIPEGDYLAALRSVTEEAHG